MPAFLEQVTSEVMRFTQILAPDRQALVQLALGLRDARDRHFGGA